MKRGVTFILLISIGLLFGCQNQADQQNNMEYEKVRGNRFYGGTFNVNENEFYHDLFPHAIIDATGARIATQIYEGLVKFNPIDLSVQPAIAQSWEKDSTGTIYTFKLRDGIKFHDDPCFNKDKQREVTAHDFKFCFQLLCTQHEANAGFSQTFKDIVKGATQYYEASTAGKPKSDLEGIKVIDDHTLQIELKEPFAPFIYILASPFTSVFPEEAYKKYGIDMRVGTGPFQLNRVKEKQFVVLEKNPDYYRYDKYGNQLPYLDSIRVGFMPDKDQEVTAFKKGDLDMVYQLPTDAIINILETKKNKPENEQYIQQRTPEMSLQYYEFLNTKSIFEDKKIRKAFNYAINRSYIVKKILGGEAYAPGRHGITPPTIKGYDVSKIKGYKFDTSKAKQLLAQAGYKDGKDFPTITLDVNPGGGRNIKVAKEVQRQLKEYLNVDIKLNKLSLNEKIQKSKMGKSKFWRSGWIADYPHPQNFLMLLYGKYVPEKLDAPSFPNTSRYNSAEFNKLYQKGLRATTPKESYKYFLKAEQAAMDDAPILVLWYEESYRILQPYIRDFPNNAIQYRDFSKVWFDFEWKEKDQNKKEKAKKTA